MWALFPETEGKRVNFCQLGLTARIFIESELGGELHGPEDVMYVSREQVLFWENLKDDGKVATAIKDYQASGKK